MKTAYVFTIIFEKNKIFPLFSKNNARRKTSLFSVFSKNNARRKTSLFLCILEKQCASQDVFVFMYSREAMSRRKTPLLFPKLL